MLSGANGQDDDVALRIKGAHVLGKLLATAPEEEAQRALGSPAASPEGALLVLLAAFLAKPALGAKLLEEDQDRPHRPQAAALASSKASSPTAQALAAELFNVAANSEQGRACLGAFLQGAPQALQALMASSTAPGTRVAAASAFTKLGLAAKVSFCGC
jgi:hypothetical protein